VSRLCLPKDRIFAYLNLDDSDLKVYEKSTGLEQEVAKPELVIYMQASVPCSWTASAARPGLRARDGPRLPGPSERGLLVLLLPLPRNALLVVNTDDIDFVNNPATSRG